MKRTKHAYRVAVMPVRLNGRDYRTAHESCHKAALLWNHAVSELHSTWEQTETDPTTKQMRHLVAAASSELLELHAHTKQAITDDLLDAVATYRKNKRECRKAKAPWREKQYRPLSFTAGYGWRIVGDHLNLSLGRGRPSIRLPLPLVTDSTSGTTVDPELWGEIRLCWDRDARQWTLHIAYQTAILPVLNPANRIAVDPGIINPMTVALQTPEGFEVTVINGRAARAIKHRRNTAVAPLRTKMARCTKGSRQWRRYSTAIKRANACARSSLRNIDHQVSRKVANLAITHDAGTIVVGDVRGIEKSTKKAEKRRFGKDQRRRLSQWSRGTQDRYLGEKTGVELTYLDESWSSKTCPACLTRNRPSGRYYLCHECKFTCHRDAVGAINILMRSIYGAYTRINPNAVIRVIYLRATPLRVALSKAQNRATTITGCVAELRGSHATVADLTVPTALTRKVA
jgi:putative transposase